MSESEIFALIRAGKNCGHCGEPLSAAEREYKDGSCVRCDDESGDKSAGYDGSENPTHMRWGSR